MFFATPSTKEHTMKRIATTVAVVALAALTLTSMASAAWGRKAHTNLRPGAHAVAKPSARSPQKAPQRFVLRLGHTKAAY